MGAHEHLGRSPLESRRTGYERLEAVSWICPREAPPSPDGTASADEAARTLAGSITSDLTKDGGEPSALAPPRITRDGDCYRVSDAFAPGAVAPGAYIYAIRWK